jgi:hypothetical protein
MTDAGWGKDDPGEIFPPSGSVSRWYSIPVLYTESVNLRLSGTKRPPHLPLLYINVWVGLEMSQLC